MVVTTKDGLEKSIKAIGQSLINRAEDIAKDTRVFSLIIHAELNPSEIVIFDITKTYSADPYTESLKEINKEV